jgi:hypothetical protein
MALVESGVAELSNLIPEMWSENMYDELRADQGQFRNFFFRDYEGEIKKKGDTVKINTFVAPTGELLEVGVSNTFDINSEAITITQQEVKADRIARASFVVENIADLQSMSFQAEAQEALLYAVGKQMEDYIISGLIPDASHDLAPIAASDFAAADMSAARRLLSKHKVPNSRRRAFLDVDYYSDLSLKTQITSSDYVSSRPTESGVIGNNLYGFEVSENNNLGADVGYFCHPTAMALVMQSGMEIKLSDMHPAGKDGWILTAQIVFGIKLLDNKRIVRIDDTI